MKTTLLEPEIVTRKGKPVSVILPIADYEELLERAEDADDVAWLKARPQKAAAIPSAGRLSGRTPTLTMYRVLLDTLRGA